MAVNYTFSVRYPFVRAAGRGGSLKSAAWLDPPGRGPLAPLFTGLVE